MSGSGQFEGPLHVLMHVDIVPTHLDEGTELVLRFMADSRQSPGLTDSALLRQAARKNHFELLWVWRSRADYERHLGSPATRRFRDRLLPLVGSPIEPRLHQLVEDE